MTTIEADDDDDARRDCFGGRIVDVAVAVFTLFQTGIDVVIVFLGPQP
jgi:hypothetical protein